MKRAPFVLLAVMIGCGDGSSDDDAGPPADGASPGVACVEDADCDDGRYCNGVERCVGVGADPSADARGCAPQTEPVCAGEALDCFELEERCRTVCDVTDDADGDGVASMDCDGTDCDDTDPFAFPGNLETCDFVGHDEDCDPSTFGSDRDIDGDGEPDAACFNGPRDAPTSQGTDCDDRRAFIAPGQPEVCNGLDDDCDGTFDEGVTVGRYRDGDGDGDGDAAASLTQVCPDATGYAETNTDCDDTTPLYRGSPWFELCDGEDNDCDGTTDEDPRAVAWYVDGDGDGFGDAEQAVVISCAPVAGRSLLGTDCDDALRGVSPVGTEQCNGLDDDCNGRLDFRDATMFEDEDGDGVPNAMCGLGLGDCDDRDFFSGGDAPEICADMADNDCDGMVDEAGATPVAWYPDLDGDGWGDRDSGPVATQCERLPRASFRVADCDDSDPLRHPFTPDGCDGRDDDCDGRTDEDAPRRIVFPDADGDGAGVEMGAQLVCGATPAGFADVPRDCAPSDPMLTFRWADADMDGRGGGEPLMTCTGGVAVGGDCDDSNPALQTGCVELCNGMDDDADGRVDETGAMGCPNAGHTMWTCAAGGTCMFGGCAAGGTDCDGLAENGCEANFDTTPLHCGGCGMSCGIGADCVARACTTSVVDIQLNNTSTCVLRGNGRVVCWGQLPPGQPELRSAFASSDGVLQIDGATIADATWLEAGRVSLCVGRADGALRCATVSTDTYGVSGHGTSASNRPMAVVPPVGLSAYDSSIWHGCGIGAGGSVLCRGYNGDGQLGRGNRVNDPSPATAVGVSGATRVTVGQFHSCVVAGTSVFCWGRGSSGQLGNSSTLGSTIPLSVPMTNAATNPPIDVAASSSGTCVLRMNGDVECTGVIASSALFSQRSLTLVGNVPGATRIAGSPDHYCVAASTGAYCFGNDTFGKLGNGPAGVTITPTAATGLTSAIAVDAGVTHSCAVTAASEVYCWGSNGNGQLGTTTGNSDVPAPVAGLP